MTERVREREEIRGLLLQVNTITGEFSPIVEFVEWGLDHKVLLRMNNRTRIYSHVQGITKLRSLLEQAPCGDPVALHEKFLPCGSCWAEAKGEL
jgi:hypothetical protein